MTIHKPMSTREVSTQEYDIGHNTAEKAVRGGIWTVIFQLASMVLRFGSNLVFAWLLAPEDFGLMALVMVFMFGLLLFSDVGFEDSIVRSRRGDERLYRNTVWSMQIIRGVILALLCVAIAYPVANIYDKPDLAPLIMVSSLSLLVLGFQSTSLAILRRHLHAIALARLDLIAQLGAFAVGLIWAVFDRSVWLLMAAATAGWVIKLVLSHFMDKDGHDRAQWDWETFYDVLKLGKWVFVSTTFMFLALQIDRLLLGKLVSTEQLGVYHIAIILASIPDAIVMQLSMKVIYPMLSHYVRVDPGILKYKLREMRSYILPVALYMILGVIFLSEPFFTFLYREEYKDAAWIAPLLAGVFWISIVQESVLRTTIAMGSFHVPALTNFVALICRGTLAYVAFQHYGLAGFIVGLMLGSICGYLVVIYWLLRNGITNTILQDVYYSALLLGIAALYYWVKTALLPDQMAWHLGWSLGLMACFSAIIGAWGYRHYKAGRFRQTPDQPPLQA